MSFIKLINSFKNFYVAILYKTIKSLIQSFLNSQKFKILNFIGLLVELKYKLPAEK